MQSRGRTQQRGIALVGAALVVGVAALLATSAPWVTHGFGASHDGYNGAMWGLSARATWDDPLGSRLGGIQPDGLTYANHPPLIIWLTALSAGIGREAPLAVRAPAIIASIVALTLVARLLVDAGLRTTSAAAGLVVAATTGLFRTYGTLLDTPVVSLPFGLGALLVAQRGWQGRPARPALALGIGVLAALAGWQSLLLAGGAAALAALAPEGRGRRSAALLGGGVALGAAVDLAWIMWVKGSFAKLLRQAELRSGPGASGPWASAVAEGLGDLVGPVGLGLVVVGAVLAVARGRGRHVPVGPVGDDLGAGAGPADPTEGVAAEAGHPWWSGIGPATVVLVGAVVAYTVGFRQAAAAHDYWIYWTVALVAVASATLVDAATTAARRAPGHWVHAARAAIVVAVVVVVAVDLGRSTEAAAREREGLEVLAVLDAAPSANSPTEAVLAVRNAESGAPWARWATGGRVLRPDRHGLASLPDHQLLLIQTVGPPTRAVRDVAIATEGRWVLLRAGDYRETVGR